MKRLQIDSKHSFTLEQAKQHFTDTPKGLKMEGVEYRIYDVEEEDGVIYLCCCEVPHKSNYLVLH